MIRSAERLEPGYTAHELCSTGRMHSEYMALPTNAQFSRRGSGSGRRRHALEAASPNADGVGLIAVRRPLLQRESRFPGSGFRGQRRAGFDDSARAVGDTSEGRWVRADRGTESAPTGERPIPAVGGLSEGRWGWPVRGTESAPTVKPGIRR